MGKFTKNASKLMGALKLLVVMMLTGISVSSFGQIGVTVTNPTNTTPNLAATYPNFTAAVTALNGVTAMSGPVTLTLAAGTNETAPVKGFNISTSTAGVLNATNTLTIVKAAGAATVINAGVGTAATAATASPDGMLYLSGSDYVTIDGITFTDGNAASALVSMEFGVALFKRAAGDGCNNNTIQNCIFNMQRINNSIAGGPMGEGANAIEVVNSTVAAAVTALTPTNSGTLATNGTNSNNAFYSNQINGGNAGIHLSGYAATVGVGPAPTATTFLGDINNIVGASTLGNTILNYGGGAAVQAAVGIRASNQWSVSIRYNTIDNNNGAGVNHATTLRGIYAQTGTSAAATVSDNSITVRSGATASALTAIENAIGITAAANTVNINDNVIRFSYTTATSGVFTGVLNSSTAATVNINNNNIQQLAATNYPSTGTLNVITAGSPVILNITGNTISNFVMTATTGTLRGINGTTPTGLYSITGNTVENFSYTTAASTGSLTGIYNLASATNMVVNNNIIRNFSTPTTGTLNGIQQNTVAGTFQCKSNQIYNFSTTAGGAGGFSANGITWSNATCDLSNNIIYAINSTGSTGGTGGTINGITHSGASTVNGNAIYDLSTNSTGGVVNGINVAATGTNTVSNNLIGDLRAPNSTSNICISGMLVSSGTTNNIFHNTINVANTTASATTSGSSAIYFSSSTPVNNLRNNVFVNTSTPGPTGGFTAAIRYTAAPTSTNFPAANNNNFYYAGVPAANQVIYCQGATAAPTNGQQTISDYRTYIGTTLPVSGREGNSISEIPNFVSVTGSNPITNFLKYSLATATGIEQGAVTGTGITTDYSGSTLRCPNGACPGGGSITTPDMGAWELNNTICNSLIATLTNTTPVAYCAPGGAAVAMTGAGSGGTPGYTRTWTPAAGLWTNAGATIAYVGGADAGAVWATPASAGSYTLTVTDAAGCTKSASKPFTINPGINLVVTPASGTICPGDQGLNAAATPAAGYYALENYTFGFASNGSLLSTAGSTPILSGNNDDASSAAQNIGFTFNFGGVDYTQYSISSNGHVRFGSAAFNAAPVSSTIVTTPFAGVPLLLPMAGDNEVNNGVHFLLTGSAPNRRLIIEWREFYVNFTNLTNAGNMQVWLDETTNTITYVYGNIFNSNVASQTRSIGLATSNTATTAGSVTIGGTPTFALGSSFAVNTIAAGSGTATGSPLISNLGSAADGSRWVYTFTAPSPASFNYAWTELGGNPLLNLYTGGLPTSANQSPTAEGLLTTGVYGYPVTVTNTGNGCTASGQANVTVATNALVAPVPTVNFATRCVGQTVTLTGTNTFSGGCAPFTFVWKENGVPVPDFTSGGGSSSGTIITVASTAGLLPGMFLSVTAGTGSFAALTRVTNVTNSTTFLCNVAPSVALSGATVVAKANGILPFASSTNVLVIAPPVGAPVVYTLDITDNALDNQSGTVNVTVNPLPVVVVSPNTANICTVAGTPVALSASGATSYTWSPITSLFTDAGVTTPYAALTDFANVWSTTATTRTYTVTGTDAGTTCTNTATATITAVAPPVISATTATPSSVCPGNSSALAVTISSPAGAAAYNFAPSNPLGTFSTIVGAPGAVSVPLVAADTYISPALPIGFSFSMGGTLYTNVYASSNGFLSFNSGAAANTTNSIAASAAANYPLVAPLWDDLDATGTGGAATYLTTGAPGSRIFTFEWTNFEWNWLSSTANISFQCKLYEATGNVEFVYNNLIAPNSPSASIGIATAVGNYLSLNGTGASPTASSVSETTTLSANPATGQTYTFSPPAPPVYTYAWSPGGFISGATNLATATTTNLAASQAYTVNVSNAACTSIGNTSVTVTPLSVIPTATPLPQVATVPQYTFAQTAGAYTAMVGGTTSTAVGDDGTQTSIPIGFTFTYRGLPFTTFSITTNGAIGLGATAPGFTNGLSTTSNFISPFWEDNDLDLGTLKYQVTGVSPNQILTVEWYNIATGGTGANANSTNQFQVKLYENNGNIQFIYGNMTDANGWSASIGLSGGTVAQFLSVTPASGSATVSSVTANNTIAAATFLTSGTIYTFSPPLLPNCSNNLWNLSAGVSGGSAPYTYDWTVGSVAGLSATNIENPTVSGVPTASYSVSVLDGCGNTVVGGPVTRTVVPSPTVTVTPATATFCSNATPLALNAGGAVSYAWSPATGLSAVTGASVNANPSASITYTVTGTAANSCTGTATSVITVANPPNLNSVTATPAIVCPNGNSVLTANAAISIGADQYTFAASAGSFVEITGGTLVNSTATNNGQDSYVSTAQTIPAFTFAGVAYTTVWMTSNGSLNLGGAVPSTVQYNVIANTTGSGISIAPFNADLAGTTFGSDLRWEQVGSEIVFQWKNFSRFNRSERFSFQARLNTSTGVIRFVYGDGVPVFAGLTTFQPVVGIRTSPTAFSNLSIVTGAETWAAPLMGSVNTATCRFTTDAPAKNFSVGQTYTFTPPVVAPLTYTWSETPGSTLASTIGATVNANSITAALNTYTVSVTDGTCPITGNATVSIIPLVAVPSISPYSIDATNYVFSATSGSFTPLVGGTVVPTVMADDAISAAIPIGFNFTIGSTTVTNAFASSNGFLSFNPLASSTLTNNLTSGAAAIFPLVAPLWDDLDGQISQSPNSQASFLTTGISPNRIFTFEWLKWQWSFSANNEVISFQVKLYEANNKIEFVYQDEANPVVDAGSPGASIGIATSPGVFLSLGTTDAAPPASSVFETSNLGNVSGGGLKPATGQIYSFVQPSNLCSGAASLLNANISGGGLPYSIAWSSSPGGFSSAASSVVITPTVSTTYTVNVTDNCGTVLPPANVVATVLPNTLNISQSAASVCGDIPVTLDATASTGIDTYNWFPNIGIGNNFTAPTVVASPAINFVAQTITGFNADVVANGIGAPAATTTADVNGAGTAYFTAITYQVDGSAASPIRFVPTNNTVTSTNTPGLKFNLASYSANNSLRLSSGTPSGILTFPAQPMATNLYLLATHADVANTSGNLTVLVTFTDASTQTANNVLVRNWLTGAPSAGQGFGYLNAAGVLQGNNTQPRFFDINIPISALNQGKQIASITVTRNIVTPGIIHVVAASVKLATPAPTITYTLTGVASNGCIFTKDASFNYVTPPVLSLSTGSLNFCSGSTSADVTLTSNPADFTSYSWSDPAITTGNLTAGPYSFTPLGSGLLTLTATNSGTGCKNTQTLSLIVRPIPSATVVTPVAPETFCFGPTRTITANSPAGGSTNLLAQNFDGTPTGWVITGNHDVTVGGDERDWNYRTGSTDGVTANGYSYVGFAPYSGVAATVKSAQGGRYAIALPDASGAANITRSILTSPSFSTLTATNLALTFEHLYAAFPVDDISVRVEITDDNFGTSTVLQDYFGGGDVTPFTAVSLPIPAGFWGKPSVKIRFSYESNWGGGWLLDDVKVTGDLAVTGYRWFASAPGSGLPNSALLTNIGNASVNFVVNPGTPWTYDATASNVFGCTTAVATTGAFTVNARPIADISANDFVCSGQSAPVNFFFTGTGTYDMQYTINGGAPITANGITSPYVLSYGPATIDRTYEVVSLIDGNCTALPVDLDMQTIVVPSPCEITWDGSESSDWDDANNWTPNNSAPSPFTSIRVPLGTPFAPQISGVANCATINLVDSPIASIDASGQLNIKGDVSGGLGSTINGLGRVVFNGTGLQTVTGRVLITNVDFANNSTQGVVIAPDGQLYINPNTLTGTGLVNFLSGSRLTNTGKFVLGSNANATAKIGVVPIPTFITGDITQERYIPFSGGGATGGWYFIGSPFGGNNFTNYSDDFKVTGLTSGFGSQGGGIISSTEPERSSIFKYTEALHNVHSDTVQKIGWRIPANENVAPGTGYRAYINYYSASRHLFTNSGALTSGDFSFPTLTRNEYAPCFPTTPTWSIQHCNEENRGYNLLANPYPCDIDWDAPAVTAWDKPVGMSDAWYRWHTEANGYGVYAGGIYAGTTPAPSNPNLIPSGQSFFVKLAAAGTYTRTLGVKEQAKSVVISGQYLRTNVVSDIMRINMSKVGNNHGYDAVIRFMDQATDEYDLPFDFTALGGGVCNITIPVTGQEMSISSYAPITEFKIIPLTTKYQGGYGNFELRFSQMENLLAANIIYLKDNVLGSLEQISVGSVYAYTASSTDGLIANRFELIFNPQSITSVTSSKGGASMNILPNPSESQSGATIALVGFEGVSVDIQVADMLGRTVSTHSVTLKSNGITEYHLNEKLAAGVYTVKTSGISKTISQKMVVK